MISKVHNLNLRESTSRLAAALFIVFCLPAALWAQGATGSITGTVEDSTGAVIPGAAVTLTNQATGLANQIESQADGSYFVPNLQPGDYTVSVEIEGFKRQDVTGLRINAGSTVTQAITLEIGVVTETVEVSAQAVAVETTSGQVGSTVQIEQILEMPSISRNVFSLVNLVPGAFYAEDLNNPNATRVSLGGGRTQSASAMVDGVNNTRGGLGVQNVEMSPPIDAMQEFKVEVNNLGAEYGRSSAGVINAVTKSGTNAFHGSFYEFLRNDKLDAAGWNNDTKPSLRRNNFGGTVGGPIVKNRTFFFYNLDVLRIRQGVTRTRSVGFPEFQQGDFSRATARIKGKTKMVPIYDPDTGSGTFAKPKGTSLFPNNTIPLTRFDPVAAAVVAGNYIPAANRTPNNIANNSGNWQQIANDQFNRNFHTMKLDHEWTSNTRSFVRYILTIPDEDLSGYTPGYGVADQNGLAIKNKRQNLALNLTHLFSPTFILNATAGFNRVFVDRKSGDCCDTNYATKFGLSNESVEKGGEVFPRFNHGGGLVPVNQIGAVGNAHRDAVFTNFDYVFNFTKTRGSHTFKFGTQFSAYQGNELSRPSPSGIYGFNGRWTQKYDAKGKRIGNTGIRYADFLLGRLNSVDSRVAGTIGKRIKVLLRVFPG